MHIPDGYLSPSTCATLYAGAAVGWYSALRRLKRALFTRVIPLISVFAAFSFVVMMFNLPLPGGTTGHALGVTVAAIVLGPSGAILALSIAIAIQALFFGDGGISTLGANCFNMAIVGALVGYGIYRLIAARAALTSKRRVVAAAVAGYLAVNAAALLASIEFGIQPMLFHDASGTPLYAPYPLSIAIPAMMIGHLTFAGMAEAVISAGLVAYLQVADPALLRGTAGLRGESSAVVMRPASGSLQRLWMVIAVLMLLTPLGILAAGSAWGEWKPEQLAASTASNLNASSMVVPAGLQRLSNFWTAPFPAYAPAFVRNRGFGYLLSAMFGVGLLLLISLLARFVLERRHRTAGAA
jgi:cobalt/nickel transport system permease protein